MRFLQLFYRHVLSGVLLLLLLWACTTDASSDSADNKIFEKIASTQSKVTFNNKLTEDVASKFNLLDFDYFYNGAGVGIADLDNDGLKDIVFTGNQVDNKIYRNVGDLIFDDVTAVSGINTNKHWSNGVTFADVNMDGWLDIYICQGGPHENGNRKNLLFINQQDLTFKESGAEFGLDDDGLSTQAAFFDYDKDGDLDCVVMNESVAYGYDPISFNNLLAKNKQLLDLSTSKLYENVDGKYQDKTKEAGLYKPSFGLGLVVSDIDDDGWLDIYIANDYYIPDAMYINQGNGKFKEVIKQATSQVSMFGMGADIADLNQDGLQDIFVLDMASSDHYRSKTLMASMSTDNFITLVDVLQYQHQYMFNSLQINAGNNKFHNLAHQAGLGKTDWSWAGLMTDFDNDSNRDVFVSNGYRRYALDNDFKAKVLSAQREYRGNVPLDVKQKLYNEMPEEPLANLIYQNRGDMDFKLMSAEWGLDEKSYSNGAAIADLDNDGDYDLVVNNIDSEAFIYRNKSSDNGRTNFLKVKLDGKLSESFAKVRVDFGDRFIEEESKRVRGYFSAVDEDIIFGLGDSEKIKRVTVEWPSGFFESLYDVKANSTITFNESSATLLEESQRPSPIFEKTPNNTLALFYNHVENDFDDFKKEILLPYKQSTLGPFITTGDVNGDERDDIFISGASGIPSQLFLQEGDGFKSVQTPAFEKDKASEDMHGNFVDIDNDGDLDLYVCSGGNEFAEGSDQLADKLYMNDGKGGFSKDLRYIDKNNLNSKKSIHLDLDRDGDLDIVVGSRIIPQQYPRPEVSKVLLNDNGKLEDRTEDIAPGFSEFGIINDLIVTDFNGDGWEDFIAVGEWTDIGMFVNEEGRFRNVTNEYGLDDMKGWWFTIKETDVNKDGLPDYILGNVGMNTKFKASNKKPFKVFASDFDANGTFDIVLSNVYEDEYVPVRGKECSSQQMPFISEKFQSYDAFASASLVDIYGESLKTASEYEANTFSSYLLLNKGNSFDKVKLPSQAQSFPILSCEVIDINLDGYEDLILAGSIYNTEVETPRWDAGSGLVLLSDKRDNYKVLSAIESSLYIDGDIKSIKAVDVNGTSYLLGGVNNGLLSIHKIHNQKM